MRSTDYTKEAYWALCEAAITTDHHTIVHVDPAALDEALCMCALRNGCSLQYIPNSAMTVSLYVAGAVRNPGAFHEAFMLTRMKLDALYEDDVHVALATARPFLWLGSVLNIWGMEADNVPQTLFSSAFLAAVKKDGMSLRFVGKPSTALIEAAVEQNPLAISYVTRPDRRMCLGCYRRDKNSFAFFDDGGRRYVARLELADSMVPLRSLGLSPNLASEICVELVKWFPRTCEYEPSTDELVVEFHLNNSTIYIRQLIKDRSRNALSWEMSFHDIWALVRHVRGT